tara:strand:+ start:190 stop:879 length:690 start_codon:yes stop_codon:yes gene_type:complete
MNIPFEEFKFPLGFYTTYTSYKTQCPYKTIELLKVNSKTILIKCSDFDKAVIRKPKFLGNGFCYFEIKNASYMGRCSPTIFDLSDAYYTKHKPTQEELERDFVAGEIILKSEEPKKKNTNKEVFDTLNYLINNNFAKEYDSKVDNGKDYWMTIEGTEEVYTKIMGLETNIKSVINLQNELVKLTQIVQSDGGKDTVIDEKDIEIFYDIHGDDDIYKMIKKCLGKHYTPN